MRRRGRKSAKKKTGKSLRGESVAELAPHEVTRILEDVGQGDAAARARLMALVYDELHRLAAGQMRRERPDHTLQPTALVNEAYLRLIGRGEARWQNRAHFFGAAAEVMRRILVDHARARLAAKRGGERARLPLDEMLDWTDEQPWNVIAIDEALQELETLDPQRSRIVNLRFFAGLTSEQIAEMLGISVRTVKRQWRYTRAWLYRAVAGPA
ncbi:MAG: sigma-70 family RNA polymerase sigma factor [Planctomycetes bacterium]|nr:sigma-70 family RNA polymerase sigma factor [Planctomycetota bacterium]